MSRRENFAIHLEASYRRRFGERRLLWRGVAFWNQVRDDLRHEYWCKIPS
jgi:hypothetical protein